MRLQRRVQAPPAAVYAALLDAAAVQRWMVPEGMTRHDGLPPGVSAADNALGWRTSMDQLARLVEHGAGGPAAESPR